MGKWCLQASSFIFYQISVKHAGNQDRHKIMDEFKFRLDRMSLFGVTCPWGWIKYSIDILWNVQVQLTFQTLEFVSHFSWELWGLEDWNLVHTWAVGRCIMYIGIRLLLLIRPFISSFFFLSTFQHWNFLSHFSRELWVLEDWKLVHTWTVGWCIMYTGIRLLLLICPFLSSFFFLSNFQTLKFFVTLLSRTVRPRRLKLGTHVDSGQMYSVYRNQAAAAYSSLYFFIFFLSNSQTLNFFVTFIRYCEA